MTPGDLNSLSDEELLTACLWAEARGEPEEGQHAVCNVILNRVKKRMAANFRAVILKPRQFSWTDSSDPNFDKVFTAPRDSAAPWARARRIAVDGIAGVLEDKSLNADHYLNVEVTKRIRGGTLPKWAQDGIDQGRITVVIGSHTFLRLHD